MTDLNPKGLEAEAVTELVAELNEAAEAHYRAMFYGGAETILFNARAHRLYRDATATVSALQARVRELEEERDRLTGALEISHFAPWLRGWVKTRFGKWITHNTAKGALAEYRAALSPVQQDGSEP